MKKPTLFLSTLIAAFLTACGGGGSSSQQMETDYVSKYVGTWKTACWTASIYQDTAVTPSANAYLTRSLTFTKTSGSVLSLSATDTVYGSTDTTCSGAVQATVTRTGQNTNSSNISTPTKTMTSSLGVNTATYVGTGALGAVTGDRFDAVQAALYSVSNATLTIGTISLNAADFLAASGKVAYYLNTAGTTLTSGTGATASTYPNALGTGLSQIFTKQ